MAGHSKWANIQHRKGRQDEKRGKAWTRVIREIMVAARLGGGDPSANPRLRLAIEKAKAVNLPVDTVKRNIDKATGNLEGVSYEEIRYEGYGIGGAALIVDCMTDNRVRTVAEVRHAFSKYGGNMGTEGSVAFQFKHCGQFVFAPGTPEDKLMEAALEAGAEDVITGDDGSIEVLSAAADFEAVKIALEAAEDLAGQGIEAEVIDLRSLRPLDTATVIESVKKTNRIVCCEEGWRFFGFGAEIAAAVTEHAFDYLDAPPMRVAQKDVPLPYAANLEKLSLPNAQDIVAAAKKVCYREVE